MISRRDWLKLTGAAGTALYLNPNLLLAAEQGGLIERAIPSSGEKLPMMGLGSSATFSSACSTAWRVCVWVDGPPFPPGEYSEPRPDGSIGSHDCQPDPKTCGCVRCAICAPTRSPA